MMSQKIMTLHAGRISGKLLPEPCKSIYLAASPLHAALLLSFFYQTNTQHFVAFLTHFPFQSEVAVFEGAHITSYATC
jgi:hypothetical protein